MQNLPFILNLQLTTNNTYKLPSFTGLDVESAGTGWARWK